MLQLYCPLIALSVLLQDPYDRQDYFRAAFHARLEHAHDWKAIPASGTTIQVELPVIPEQAGGVGIADIQHLLYSKDRVRDDEFQALMDQSQTTAHGEGSPEDKVQTRTIEVTILPSSA